MKKFWQRCAKPYKPGPNDLGLDLRCFGPTTQDAIRATVQMGKFLRGEELNYLNYLEQIAESDVAGLCEAEKSYGDSWKKRGGVGAFMMLARKWDRIEKQVSKITDSQHDEFPPQYAQQYDVFAHVREDARPEGIIDDIRDLRRYLLLVEAELMATGNLPTTTSRTDQEHPFGYNGA